MNPEDCALCHLPVEAGEPHVTTLTKDEGFNVIDRGVIHVECLRPVVDSQ